MLRAAFLMALSPLWLSALEPDAPGLKTAASLDLRRYAGRWYEIARLPNRFQNDCARNVTAHYLLRPDGKIDVVNQCLTDDGRLISAAGVARVAEPGGAKLKVRFAPRWLAFLPQVWGDYWVLDLAADYSWAVVGEPRRKFLWVLARRPQLEPSLLEELLGRVAAQGYDLSALVRTRQD